MMQKHPDKYNRSDKPQQISNWQLLLNWILVLDRRSHGRELLYNQVLVNTQGAALLAYNDVFFSDKDWQVVQTMYKSSRTSDTSYIPVSWTGLKLKSTP